PPGREVLAGSQDACRARSERVSVPPARDGHHGRSDVQDPQLRRHPAQRPRASHDQQAVQPRDAGDAQGSDRHLRQARGRVPHHEALGFWRAYVFSVDHKVIGIQYGITGLLFLFFGFSLMMLMRWQLAYPGAALPLLGRILGEARMPGGTMLPEFYNELGAMHGTIMVFLGVVPLAVGRFGNFVLPLQL